MVEKVSRRSGAGQVLLIGLLLLSGCVALLMLGGSGDAPAFAGARAAAAEAPGQERSGALPGVLEESPSPGPSETRRAVEGGPPEGADQPEAAGFTIAGRCVDDLGRPLAEVAVVGEFLVPDHHESDAWLQEPDAASTAPETRTDDAGRFELSLLAAGRGEVTLHLEHEGLLPVWLYSFRKDLLPGARLELGDVTMTAGQRVTGRVVDTAGQPVPGAEVRLWNESDGWLCAGWQGYVGEDGSEAITDERGRFTLSGRLPAGDYYMYLPNRRVLRPLGNLVLTPGREPAPLQVVTAAAAGGARGPITGRVVDDAGEPLRRVGVLTGRNRNSHDSCQTRADGSFELHPRRDARDAVDLFVELAGRVGWSAATPVPWGTRDLEIVLVAGPRLTLVVTDARDGSPVERFGISLEGEINFASSPVTEHPGGRFELDPLTPEPLAVRVIAPSASGLIDPVGTRVDLQSDTELHVKLLPQIVQPVEVVDEQGHPVADVVVQWVEYPEGTTLEPLTAVQALAALEVTELADEPRVVSSTRTDLRGLARLSGVAGPRNVAIRVPGPGCGPTVVTPRGPLDPEVPLRIEVSRHGSLILEFGPDDVLAALRQQAVDDQEFDWEDVAFGVGLIRADPHADSESVGLLPADLGELPYPFPSGSLLTVAGVPAGLWQVRIGWGNRDWARSWPVGSPLRLDEAEVQRARIGLDELRQQRLLVRVLLNGQPVAAAEVYCSRRTDGEADEDDDDDSRSGETGADGSISFLVPPGTWVVSAWSNRADWNEVEVVVDRTSEARVELACSLATRAIRVLRPDGSPLTWSEDLLAEAEQGYPSVACTDDAGRSVLSGEPGLVTLRIPRAPFLVDGDAAWERFQEQNPDVDEAARWIELGKIELRAGDDPNESLLRLPPEWAELPR